MTIEQFKNLNEEEKMAFIKEAPKVTEKLDGFTLRRLFKLENFFIEIKNSLLNRYKSNMTIYTRVNLPILYAEDF